MLETFEEYDLARIEFTGDCRGVVVDARVGMRLAFLDRHRLEARTSRVHSVDNLLNDIFEVVEFVNLVYRDWRSGSFLDFVFALFVCHSHGPWMRSIQSVVQVEASLLTD